MTRSCLRRAKVGYVEVEPPDRAAHRKVKTDPLLPLQTNSAGHAEQRFARVTGLLWLRNEVTKHWTAGVRIVDARTGEAVTAWISRRRASWAPLDRRFDRHKRR